MRTNRLKARIRPHTAPATTKIAAFFVGLGIRALAKTIHYQHSGADSQLKQLQDRPIIFCIWHNRLALSLPLYQKLIADPHPSRRLAALVSASRDGALLSEILAGFQVQPIRGSSSRRGSRALIELIARARKGWDIAITPDGPRGPKYQVQEGVITAAQLTGLPILPIGYELTSKWTTKSWDQFQIPRPFAACKVKTASPFYVPRYINKETRKTIQTKLQSTMNAITVT